MFCDFVFRMASAACVAGSSATPPLRFAGPMPSHVVRGLAQHSAKQFFWNGEYSQVVLPTNQNCRLELQKNMAAVSGGCSPEIVDIAEFCGGC